MKMSDLAPEEREEIIRIMKERFPDLEPGDDMEVDYYLFPFPKNREVMAIDKAKEAGVTDATISRASR